ncbi:MAG: hypothetical protein R8N23_10465 [Reichenbachiella sp.]|uniref:hypothetical protein n=1 Tax=Reichenbachiella sp. TaxID=2184521 RepID=UPI002966E286|nr:hypothetical protein [Reichenbachiella sp.]MDW3210281.1 hypothetical protein [Reichenbachiella sp.]
MKEIQNIKITTSKVGVGLLLSLMFIGTELTAQIVEVGIIRDVSESSNEAKAFDEDAIFRKMITYLDLKDSDQGVNFRTATCGESRIAEIRLAPLQKADDSWFASSSERDKALRQFLAKAKVDLDYLADQPCDEQQTNLYRTIVAITKDFHSSASSKTLFIFSDGIEVSSAFNALRYKNNPAQVITDFDAIVEALERDALLPDLAGFSVILITPGKTDMELWMSRFWERLIKAKGGAFQARAAF